MLDKYDVIAITFNRHKDINDFLQAKKQNEQ